VKQVSDETKNFLVSIRFLLERMIKSRLDHMTRCKKIAQPRQKVIDDVGEAAHHMPTPSDFKYSCYKRNESRYNIDGRKTVPGCYCIYY
jgi:hypothetical protein